MNHEVVLVAAVFVLSVMIGATVIGIKEAKDIGIISLEDLAAFTVIVLIMFLCALVIQQEVGRLF